MKSYKRDIPGYIILVSFPDLNPHGKGLVTFSNLIGASVSEPLSSDLNVNFVCLSVCLSWTVNLP